MRTFRTTTAVAALVAAAAVTPPASASAAAAPKIVDLGTLPGDSSSDATAVNEHGTTVGSSGGKAVYWTTDRRIHELKGYAGPTEALDISDKGHIVGYSTAPGNVRTAV